MAQIPYRANTQCSIIPLLSQLSGRTVVVPQQDQTYIPNVNPSDQNAVPDRGIPQLFYGHNIMPSTQGIQSIGYKDVYPPWPVGAYVEETHQIVSVEGLRTFIGVDYTSAQTIYVLNTSGQWVAMGGMPAGVIRGREITVGTVNGVSYINIATIGTYKYSYVTQSLQYVELTGLNDGTTLGILNASGYLITWSKTGVAWSSTVNAEDFEPSDVSGAGAGEVQDAEGDIVFCQPTAYGFIVYTTNNAVSVSYSGNSTYPFNFKAIPGSGGLSSGSQVTKESAGQQYAYTTSGLQQVYHTGAKTVLPYITDFISGGTFEDFDEATNTFIVSSFTGLMKKKLTLVSDRYLVVSYGMFENQPMTHALIIDIVQTRMGKIKIPHTEVFEVRSISGTALDTARESIGILDHTGRVRVVDFGFDAVNSNGVAVFGKYEYIRRRFLSIQEIALENFQEGTTPYVGILATLDGKNFLPAQQMYPNPDNTSSETKVRQFYGDIEGLNHSLLVKGAFNLLSADMIFKVSGRR